MHIHKWGKWGLVDGLEVRSQFSCQWVGVLAQQRSCLKCGKIKLRKL